VLPSDNVIVSVLVSVPVIDTAVGFTSVFKAFFFNAIDLSVSEIVALNAIAYGLLFTG
jgi:hypothetical protein